METARYFAEFEKLHQEMDRMWRALAGLPGSRFCAPVLEPATDVFETPNHVVIVAEIPGVEGRAVEIEISSKRVRFYGEKSDSHARPDHRHMQMEICYGPFDRTLPLPSSVDPDQAEITHTDGILRIVLPKKEQPVPRQVRVTVKQSEQ